MCGCEEIFFYPIRTERTKPPRTQENSVFGRPNKVRKFFYSSVLTFSVFRISLSKGGQPEKPVNHFRVGTESGERIRPVL
jgi:hypothetical protein